MFQRLYLCAALCLVVPSVVWAQEKQPPLLTALSSVQQAETSAQKLEKPLPLSRGQLRLGDRLIVPGKRIGPIALGDTRKEVESKFGPPVQTWGMNGGGVESFWRWKKPTKNGAGYVSFGVVFQKERAIQLETNHPAFAIAQGLSVESSEAQWSTFWKEKSEHRTIFLDIIGAPEHAVWIKRGFALQVAGYNPNPHPEIESVIVVPVGLLPDSPAIILMLSSPNDPNPKALMTPVLPTYKTSAASAPRPIGRPR